MLIPRLPIMLRPSRTLLLGLGIACLPATPLPAQVVRGSVRVMGTQQPIDRAQLTAKDAAGKVLAAGVTDSLGEYAFRMLAGVPFVLEVRRLGFSMGTTEVQPLTPLDTAYIEFLMNEVAVESEAVTVTAERGINDVRLTEATRRGWKVFQPEEIMRHREKSQDFFQLLRSLGSPGVILPRNVFDCIRSTRNNRCLTYVVDGQILGPSAHILPADVYFLALLSPNQSAVQFGDRAPWGAVYVITRSNLDRVQPERAPRRQRRPPPGAPPPPASPGIRPPR